MLDSTWVVKVLKVAITAGTAVKPHSEIRRQLNYFQSLLSQYMFPVGFSLYQRLLGWIMSTILRLGLTLTLAEDIKGYSKGRGLRFEHVHHGEHYSNSKNMLPV